MREKDRYNRLHRFLTKKSSRHGRFKSNEYSQRLVPISNISLVIYLTSELLLFMVRNAKYSITENESAMYPRKSLETRMKMKILSLTW